MANDRYRALRTLLQDYEKDVAGALAAPRDTLRQHMERFTTTRWYEAVGTIYVVTGFTRDFWLALAGGLPERVRTEVVPILGDQRDEELLFEVLKRLLAVDQRYTSRLSLWARRLVGDTMLMCRSAIAPDVASASDAEIRLEPVFTDVVAQHTRRLDRLGLTA
jgi:hypothetical protein